MLACDSLRELVQPSNMLFSYIEKETDIILYDYNSYAGIVSLPKIKDLKKLSLWYKSNKNNIFYDDSEKIIKLR